MANIEKFDQMASRYDNEILINRAKIIADEIRCHIANGKNKTAIDYGCGTGLVGINLLDCFRSVLFVDASMNMVREVERKITEQNLQNARAFYLDLENGNETIEKADCIIVAQTLLHIKEIEPFLASLFDALNDGGQLIIVDFDKDEGIISDEIHNGFVQEELIELMLKLGFASAKSHTFHSEKAMFYKRDASMFLLEAVKKC